MRTIRTVPELRAHLATASGTVGLVPTMGAFHAGHESLIKAARNDTDHVVVSLFVNPAQFNDPRDLEAYPRDERRDAERAEQLGADVLFAPSPDVVYPPWFATTVRVEGLSDRFEGTSRGPGHFAGVCTVVAKLLNMVRPDVAYFGQKDAQQVAVLKRMVRDLDFPLEIRVQPTVRDADGLALSSRNVQLSPERRAKALGLSAALRAAAESGLEAGGAVLAEYGIHPDYFAQVDPDTFEPSPEGDLIVIAATIGSTRLIDNVLIERAATPDRRGADPEGAVSVLPTP
jgi:pantoate--beta-alanine ligase